MSRRLCNLARRALLCLCAAIFAAEASFGWGPEGHRVVAMIAAKNLTPEASRAVTKMLGPYDTLAALSVWADDIREEHPETAPWHYIDIPLMASNLDMRRDCADNNCVVAKIGEFRTILQNKSADPGMRRDALKFLVHFVGDLHQPLHCEDNHDEGGNKLEVMFFGEPTNLHAVWDSGILRHEKLYDLQLAAELEGSITATEKKTWAQGTPADWAMEGHALAVRVAYGKLPRNSTPAMGDAYLQAAQPVVELQLEKAGIRLATILNQALR